MSDERRESSVFERRNHYRVSLDARVVMGAVAEEAPDDPGFKVRERYADLVESLLRLRQAAEPLLQEPIDRGVDYLAALQDMVLEGYDGRVVLGRGFDVESFDGAVSLSEGGIGFPCDADPGPIGTEIWMVITVGADPCQRPIRVRAELKRRETTAAGTFLGFRFVDLAESARRYLVSAVMHVQRAELRRLRDGDRAADPAEERAR